MIGWLTRLRVRQLRRAKLIRRDRFILAHDAGNHAAATEHRKMLGWYLHRIAELTGEPESVSTKP